MSKAGKLNSQWKVIRKDKLGTNEEGQARARLQNRLQMPLKSTERSVSTLEEVAGQGRRRAEGDCWRCVWSCREIHAHTPRVFWAFISWGHIWKESYASSALQTILIPIQVSMGDLGAEAVRSAVLTSIIWETYQHIAHSPTSVSCWRFPQPCCLFKQKVYILRSGASCACEQRCLSALQVHIPQLRAANTSVRPTRKKVWLIAVGKNNHPETCFAGGPELMVRFCSQETEHIFSLLCDAPREPRTSYHGLCFLNSHLHLQNCFFPFCVHSLGLLDTPWTQFWFQSHSCQR